MTVFHYWRRSEGKTALIGRGKFGLAGGRGLTALGANDSTRSPDDPGRDETESEREDRNLVELLQELRVGALGVQVLFGFLLSLPFFAVRFSALTGRQKDLYLLDLLLAALATGMFSGPVAYHRLVFRRHRKGRLLRVANAMAIGGLVTVALAISGSVWLAVSDVEHGPIVGLLAGLTLLSFTTLWFVLPALGRTKPDRRP